MQMQEAKEMVQVASTFLAEQEPSAKNVRLEQIEERSSGEQEEWSIVLSFLDLNAPIASLMGNAARVYKELVVNGSTKEVTALRFWK